MAPVGAGAQTAANSTSSKASKMSAGHLWMAPQKVVIYGCSPRGSDQRVETLLMEARALSAPFCHRVAFAEGENEKLGFIYGTRRVSVW